ncbi:MAG: hypothetical protein M0014_04675 [Actinomycetota bacterium]|nr:hypothetical protein [Actinomycetota bacterium]
MKVTAPVVLVCWGLLNGALVLVLRGFGGTGIELALYGTAFGIIELFALAIAIATSRRPGARELFFLPRSALPACIGALGVVIDGLGLSFWPWPLYCGSPFIGIALVLAWVDHRAKPKRAQFATMTRPVDGLRPGEVPGTRPIERLAPYRLYDPPPRPTTGLGEAVRALRPPRRGRRRIAVAGALATLGAAAAVAARFGRRQETASLTDQDFAERLARANGRPSSR